MVPIKSTASDFPSASGALLQTAKFGTATLVSVPSAPTTTPYKATPQHIVLSPPHVSSSPVHITGSAAIVADTRAAITKVFISFLILNYN